MNDKTTPIPEDQFWVIVEEVNWDHHRFMLRKMGIRVEED